MKILIISDIHSNVKIMNKIIFSNKVDIKIYLGDFQISLKEQKKLTLLFDYIVPGNCDYSGLTEHTQIIEIDKLKILLTHGHFFPGLTSRIDFDQLFKIANKNKVDLILHGHDHISSKEKKGNIIRFNPGSTTFPKGGTKASYGLLEIVNGKIISLEHILL